MATQATDDHGEVAEHHEKARTMPTSRMATANRRSIMGRTRRSPLPNIMSLLAHTARQLGFFYSTIKKSAMANPGFSNSMAVAEFRYIQSLHEKSELQNPDSLVGQFLPLLRRWRCTWLSPRRIALLRADPFYYYLDARTRYYDKIFLDAIADNVQYIINVGSGVDTRAYRFKHVLSQKGVKVVECDQPTAIQVKQSLATWVGTCGHVTYLSVDLNDDTWQDFEDWLRKNNTGKALVLIEGVSPYVNTETFRGFLHFLARNLLSGSRVAYDFKLRGIADEFGRVGRTQRPFRLEGGIAEITAFHEQLGFRLEHFERSADLTVRVLANHEKPRHPLFLEDALIQLEVTH